MKSYLKFLSRNKLYTFINVLGLAISLMFVILMGDYTWRQYSIDRWHRNADRIYLMGDQELFFTWPQAAGEIRDMCPEVEQTCCVISQRGKIKYGQREIKDGEDENGIIMLADSTFFNFFDFELVKGNRQTALDAPDKCVITERLARRLFGKRNPIGESLEIVGERHVTINNEDPFDSTLVYTISAVVEDLDRTVLPNETQIIASMKRFPQVMGYELKNHVFAYGGSGACKAFYMIRPGTTFDGKMKMVEDHLTNHYFWTSNNQVTMTPLKDVFFAPQNNGSGLQKGDKTRLRILLAAVLAILFFALSNYVNLTVANTGFRAKEMATRRLFGSSRYQISLKLIAESTMMVAVSFAIGLALAFCFREDAASLFRGKIELARDINPSTVGICLGFILLTGIISGILPSWHISRYQPIDIVKGNFRFHSKMVLGKVFIILQNTITIVMLTSALVIWLQLNHLIHAPLGFNYENLCFVSPPQEKEQAVRSQLENMPFVEKVGVYRGTDFIGYSSSTRTISFDEKNVNIYLTSMDKTAFELYGLEILRDYGPTSDGYYLNEEAMRRLGLTEDDREMPWGNGTTVPIAGIIKDFHRVNILENLVPFAIQVTDDLDYVNFLIKTNGEKKSKAKFIDMLRDLGCAEATLPWIVNSSEDVIAETFDTHRHTLRIITLFTFMAIVISVLGFVGMSLFFIRQRKKEMGIRKIMGSTSREVLWLMLRTFCAPLLLSFVIAVPIAWYIMREWLMDFSYRIELSPWIFVTTCLLSLFIAIFSVGMQILKAVRTNPVESIKTE
ncbi:MAG: FtsX-like permease family protein [Bacteroidales bacterium]|nr:FtsX-like permease family protein [Bacteroidales bacterium]